VNCSLEYSGLILQNTIYSFYRVFFNFFDLFNSPNCCVAGNCCRVAMVDGRCLLPGAWCLVYDAPCPRPGVWCLVSGVWCLVSGVWCLVSVARWSMVDGRWSTPLRETSQDTRRKGNNLRPPKNPGPYFFPCDPQKIPDPIFFPATPKKSRTLFFSLGP
jgi:hypothetical protein